MPTTCFQNFCRGWLVAALAVMAVASAHAENWTRFRGDQGDGVSHQKGIPVTWSQGDYEWNIELPGIGHSSPVIFGDKLFITSAEDEGALRHLFCLNVNTGEQIWSITVGHNKSHKHIKGSWASSTPATDGERVYVTFSDEERSTLAAWDYQGHLIWRRNLGPFKSQHGQGVSPIVFDGMVILANDQDGPSSVMAFDAKTGKTVWSVLRSSRETAYATPMIYQPKGQKAQLITVSGPEGVTSLDPYTGKMNWTTGELPNRPVACPIISDGLIIASFGAGGIGKLLVAVDPEADESAGEPRIVYRRERILPYVPTSVVHKGHVYLWNDNGVVSCMELKTGKNVWTERIGGNFSGSTVLIDGKIYAINEDGKCIVIAASPKFEVLGENDLGDPSHSTPAVAGGRLYLRTFHRLAALKAEE